MKRRVRWTLLTVLFITGAAYSPLLAQSPQATISGIITDSTGAVVPGVQVTAINPATTQANTTNAFSAGAQRADMLRDPNLKSSERTLSRWFDTAAFTQPAAFTFGTGGRGTVRGDGVINFDLSLLKNFFFAEQKGFQFRLEMFNAFNHPDFGLPGATLGGPGFGVVSSARGGRNIQVGLRIVF